MAVDISALESSTLLDRLTEELTWAVIGFDPAIKSKTMAVIQSHGNGGLGDVKAHLAKDQVRAWSFEALVLLRQVLGFEAFDWLTSWALGSMINCMIQNHDHVSALLHVILQV